MLKSTLWCTFTILIVSLSYTCFTLSSPERMKFFNYIMFIPAPIAVLYWFYETRDIKVVLGPLYKSPSFSSLSFSIFYPSIFLVTIAIFIYLLGLGILNPDKMPLIISRFPTGKGLLFALLLLIGEEYAWRGYLLPRFSSVWGPLKGTIAVGLVWAIWHGPLVFGLASKLNTGTDPLLLSIVQMTAVFVFSFPFAFSYFKSGSVIPPAIFHFIWNWLNPAILGNVYRNRPGIIEGKLLFINGETIAGVILGLCFVGWFIRKPSKSFLISTKTPSL